MDDRQQMDDWKVGAIKRGLDAAQRGEIVPHEEVRAWAESLGTQHQLPLPKSK